MITYQERRLVELDGTAPSSTACKAVVLTSITRTPLFGGVIQPRTELAMLPAWDFNQIKL